MFENQSNNESYNYPGMDNRGVDKKKLLIILAIISGFIVLVILSVFLILNKKPASPQNIISKPKEDLLTDKVWEATTTIDSNIPKLPDIAQKEDQEGNNQGEQNNLDSQSLAFGSFYHKDQFAGENKIDSVNLPINIKSEVENYYDFSRKINLDNKIENLNQNGFVVLDNPFSASANDFFEVYNLLGVKNLPLLVTSDFLIYTYQNTVKEVFEDIKFTVFYNDLWQTGRELFAMADARYRSQLEKKGLVNDAELEGARLEAAYVAVLLDLLKPDAKQITKSDDPNKFSAQEAANYQFNLPSYLQEDATDYLKDDVIKEVGLIIESEKITKSPIFRYEQDYKKFKLPENIQKNAQLSNFYYAMVWLNSVFPLYFQDSSCQNCLLDKNDGMISFEAAKFLSRDFAQNQELENRWAKIYKVISYFQGLRKGLTYLHYNQALENSNLANEMIFKLNEFKFNPIEGAYSQDNKPKVGMRLLQESYRPNDYLLNNLAAAPKPGNFSADILNLLKSSPEFDSAYPEYNQKLKAQRSELGEFSVINWHENSYWTTLSTIKNLLAENEKQKLSYTQNSAWQDKVNNTAASAWLNIHLPSDKLKLRAIEKNSALLGHENLRFYLEPNIELVNDLIANTRMLKEMLFALKITVSARLNILEHKLSEVKRVILKEINNEDLNDYDIEILGDFTREYFVDEAGEKTIQFNYQNIREAKNLNGVDLLAVICKIQGKNMLSIGPIFSISEAKIR